MRTSPTPRNWLLSPTGLLLVFAVFTGCIAWWLIALPVFNLSAAANHKTHFPYVFVHTVGGTVMLFVGAANLYVGATRQHLRLHKPLGYAYFVGGMVGSVSAILLALSNGHAKAPAASFEVTLLKANDIGWALASLGMAWLGAAAMALRAARNRRFDSHRAWIIRSYVLVWAFVLCRLVSKIPSFFGTRNRCSTHLAVLDRSAVDLRSGSPVAGRASPGSAHESQCKRQMNAPPQRMATPTTARVSWALRRPEGRQAQHLGPR